MNTKCILNVVWLTVLGAFLSFSSTAYGDDHPMLQQALVQLEKAWGSGGDPPSDAERVELLKSALKLLKEAPGEHYRGHRAKAMDFVQSALSELGNGDPDHRVQGDIRDAVSEVRAAITAAG